MEKGILCFTCYVWVYIGYGLWEERSLAACLAALSASSLPLIPMCAFTCLKVTGVWNLCSSYWMYVRFKFTRKIVGN